MKLGVAIIGCGDLGTQHAKAWHAREDATVIATYDPLEDRNKRVSEDVGARACSSMEEAVLDPGVSVISIATPIAFHSEIACFAANHGRHVLSEKAIALTEEQARASIKAARDNNVHLSVSFQYRAFQNNIRYRELVRSGAFGGPIFFRYMDMREVRPKIAMHRRSMNNGPVVDMAGHHFDLVRFMTGEEPVSVYALGHVFGKGKPRLAEVEDFAIDAANIQVSFTGGHILNEFVNWGMPEGYAGGGEELFIGPAMSTRPIGGGIECTWPGRKEQLMNEGNDPWGPTARVADIASAILHGTPLTVTGEDGLAALRISLAALKSIETGQVVKL